LQTWLPRHHEEAERAVTTTAPTRPRPINRPFPTRESTRGSLLGRLLRATGHKLIGRMYLVTSFVFFMIGGVMALLMRAELARPGMQFLSPEQYNQLLTMHGTIMLLFFATPAVFAFANLVLPLQIGSPDVAFPRLNALSYWLYLFGATLATAGFLTPGGAADAGWTLCAPLNSNINSPGSGTDVWIIGLVISGLGTILGAVNVITTVITLRCPGMTMFRMPIFTLNILVTSILVLIAFPSSPPPCSSSGPTATSAPPCSTPTTAGRSSGSTCSGTSATPRSISSRCRSSASSPRSSRCSAANRCSATPA
jgi:Cytochrome C and Quinol oxidase polypeptide I